MSGWLLESELTAACCCLRSRLLLNPVLRYTLAMSSWIKKAVLLLAVVVMPVQGVAATLSFLICHGDAQAHAMHGQPVHDHAAAHDHTHHNTHNDNASANGDPTNHLCCHHTLSGVPVMALPPAIPDFSLIAMAPEPLHDLYFPDRPQRPPLV